MPSSSHNPKTISRVPTSLAAMHTLQSRTEAFFSAFASRHSSKMGCQKGCSACCHATFSIFAAEAELILHWAWNLSPCEAQNLGEALRGRLARDAAGLTKPGKTPQGERAAPCPFLIEHTCSIYPARPTLCRTQGVPLVVTHPEERVPRSRDQGQAEGKSLDVCPVHPGCTDVTWPDWREAMDLERLNTLLSLAERDYEAQEKSAHDDALKPLAGRQQEPSATTTAPRSRDSRVSLEAVRATLARICEKRALGEDLSCEQPAPDGAFQDAKKP